MFAPPSHNPAKKSAEGKAKSADGTAGPKDPRRPNPVWQSLAMRSGIVQAKLTIGQADDQYEREADRVADQVMRMPAPQSDGHGLSITPVTAHQAQRKCAECEEEEGGTLQRKESGAGTEAPATAPPMVDQIPSSPGQPLDATTRTYFEPRFGHDFSGMRIQYSCGDGCTCTNCATEAAQRKDDGTSVVSATTSQIISTPGSGQPLSPSIRRRIEPYLGTDLSNVRVHRGPEAATAARSLRARAFTYGNNIFLNRHESASDTQLMAHEASHVVQQGAGAHPRVQRALDPASETDWALFASELQRLHWPEIFNETLSSAAGQSLAATEALSLTTIPSDPDAYEEWHNQFAKQVEALVRLNALGLMATHKASIEGRRDELLHPERVPPAARAEGGATDATRQLRDIAPVLQGLISTSEYLQTSKHRLHSVGPEARTGICLSLSNCAGGWLETIYNETRRYKPDAMTDYLSEQAERVRDLPSGSIRVFFSVMSDELEAWRARQLDGVNMAMTELYREFPLFKTLDAEDVETNTELTSDPALLRAAETAYTNLLVDVDEAIVEIGSGDIHPFNLPEAVRITRESLPETLQAEMDGVIREHEDIESMWMLGLTLAQVATVFIPVIGPAIAFGIGAVTTAMNIESLLDRVKLAQASISPEDDILGVSAPSGVDYTMASIGVILTAFDLGMLTAELRAARPHVSELDTPSPTGPEPTIRPTKTGEPELRELGATEETGAAHTRSAEAEVTGEGPTLERDVHDEAHRTGADVELPQLSPEEKTLLQKTEDYPGKLPEDLATQELEIVARAKKTTIEDAGDGYIYEVDLGNGHKWKWKEEGDGTWCRFSPPPTPTNCKPGVTATSEGVEPHPPTGEPEVQKVRRPLHQTEGGEERPPVEQRSTSEDIEEVRQQEIGEQEIPTDIEEAADDVRSKLHPRLSESTTPSERLRASLEKAGIPVPPGHDAHHIVPSRMGGEAGDRARAVLEREGIHLDTEPNGVPLPSTTSKTRTRDVSEAAILHQEIHTQLYFDNLADMLEAVQEGTVRDLLRDVRMAIVDGDRDLTKIRREVLKD